MDSSSLIGQKLGSYEIIELLGRGGMATVYKGFQAGVDRYVAVKVLPPHPGQDTQFADRFQQEARTIARLQHPHILPVYDYGTQNNILYLVTAYVEGGALSDRIRRGPMPPQAVESLLKEIASALDYAHRQGVIHRDIKPDNILLNADGFVLLADFGIAKLAGDNANLTATGAVVGTPAYMAPEQGQGMKITAAADIYSLGVVVYEMLTGQQPFVADTPMHVVLKHMTEPPPSISEAASGLPGALEPVMKQVLSKNPDTRYPTAQAFAEAFSRALTDSETATEVLPTTPSAGVPVTHPAAAQATTHPTPTQPGVNDTTPTVIVQSGNSMVLLAGFAIIALLVVVVVVLVLSFSNNNTPAAPTAAPTAVVDAPAPTTLPTAATNPTTEPESTAPPAASTLGRISFSSSDAPGDTAILRVSDLAPPPDDLAYAVWLVNSETGETLRLGTLLVDAFGSGVIIFTDPDGRLLPGIYNEALITLEADEAESPSADIAYRGRVPADLTQTLSAIFRASEAGHNGGSLLEGAIAEAGAAQLHAGLAAGAGSIGGMRTHAEHTLNILNGTQEDYNGDGRPENPGRSGLGVIYFLDQIEQAITAAINAPEATLRLQADGELIRVCINNARLWVEEIDTLEREMLAAEAIEDVEEQAVRAQALAEIVVTGTDLNENDVIDPFEGECGLDQIEAFGILVGGIDIVEAADAG